MAGNTGSPGTSVAGRVLAVLQAFDGDHRLLTLSQIGTRAGIPLPTAHRLVGQLVRGGALERREDGRFVIGRALWQLGLLAPAHTDLREVASPFLHDVYAATTATVHLAVAHGTEALYLDRLFGHSSVPVVSRVGGRLPMSTTAVGKVLLAHAGVEVQREALASLARPTAHSITAPGRLMSQLRRVRVEGYATTIEEMSLGACSIAVPIAAPSGEVVAAVGVVVATLKRDRPRLLAALQVAAQGIERTMATNGSWDASTEWKVSVAAS